MYTSSLNAPNTYAPTPAYGGDMPAMPPRVTIGAELDSNEKRLAILEQTIVALEQRINPVLGPTGPSTANGNATSPVSSCSAVVTGLKAAGYKIDAAIAFLQSIIDRVEL